MPKKMFVFLILIPILVMASCDDGSKKSNHNNINNINNINNVLNNINNINNGTCGDGVVAAGELCDDGNTAPGDGCAADCTVEERWTCDTATPSVCTPWDAERWARALIAGEVTTEAAFSAIDGLTGFPVKTASGTFLFLHWYEGGEWTVAGDFNDWFEVGMARQGDFLWTEVEIPDGRGLKYKFVSAGVWQSDPWSRSYTYDEFGEISYVLPPTDLWHLERWHGLAAEGLAERMLRVYVPAGAGPWSVMYMHDGQNLFDPDAMWGGWRLQEAVATAGYELLIVGIDNSVDRMTEYTHTDDEIDGQTFVAQGDAYARLVELTVRPWIEARYPTNGLRGVMGSSLGGLISLYIAHLYPEVYHFAGSLSGTLGWGKFGLDNPLMRELYETAGLRDFAIYVDSGGAAPMDGCTDAGGFVIAEGSDNYCQTLAFYDALLSLGYTADVDAHYLWDENAEHNEAAWASRVDVPLGIFLGLSVP